MGGGGSQLLLLEDLDLFRRKHSLIYELNLNFLELGRQKKLILKTLGIFFFCPLVPNGLSMFPSSYDIFKNDANRKQKIC